MQAQRLWENLPLRKKLTLGVWLTLLPFTLGGVVLAQLRAREEKFKQLRHDMVFDAAQANAWVDRWDQEHLRGLNFVAETPGVRSMEATSAQAAMANAKAVLTPHASLTLLRPDGRIVATTEKMVLKQGLEGEIVFRGKGLSKALAGVSSTTLEISSPLLRRPCVSSTVPVYTQLNQGTKSPVGVLNSCLSISHVGNATGVAGLVEIASSDAAAPATIDFDRGQLRGYASMLVLNPGMLMLLGEKDESVNYEQKLLYQVANRHSKWEPVIKLAFANKRQSEFRKIRIGNYNYFIAICRNHPERAMIIMVDEGTAFGYLNGIFELNLAGQLLGLLVSSVAIYRICSTLAKPVDEAGKALERISQGDFATELPINNSDTGRLFSYINEASRKLQDFLSRSNAHAVTDAQLEEARRIQANFLIEKLPNNQHVELAASFTPAYQIGADWYDSIEIDGCTFVVVADVCDKGIPSALYMSVFRSLLRLALDREWSPAKTAGQVIEQALATVNRYMAETHGDTAMFATAFVGAYQPEQHLLSFVVAGHEQPMLIHAGACTALATGGPALGLFAEASFSSGEAPFEVGDLLFAFSDGLPDARDPHNKSFGKERILSHVLELAQRSASAQQVIEHFETVVKQHIDTADQFDDLTLLALKAVQNG